MLRVILSTILGLIFPFVCFMAIGIATDYMPSSALTEIKMYGQPAPGLLLAPFSIPVYFDIYIKQKHIAPEIFDMFLFRFLSFISLNWLLYGIMIYLFLGRLAKFKKERFLSSKPPPPPVFEQKI